MGNRGFSPRSGKSYNKNDEVIQVAVENDSVTGAQPVIRNDHSYIHNGIGYTIPLSDLNLANDEVIYIEFTTPIDGYIHFKNITAIDCIIRMYEIPNSVDRTGATQLDIINQNRPAQVEDNKNSDCVAYYDVTPVLGGAQFIASYQTDNPIDTREIDLLQDTTYIIEITNIAGVQNNSFLDIFYYERPKVKNY